MGLIEATRTCMSKFATFSGRASRSEYWWFLLAVVIASVVLSVVESILFSTEENSGQPLTGIFQLIMFVPLLAAAWRRLQDSGRPGWYALLPMLFSLAFVVVTLFGVFAVSVVVEGGEPAGDEARGLLSLIGLSGLMIMGAIQIAVSVLMLWWLTRPSELGTNAYGPAP
ncbi:DUF805 domain-containing protein [Rhodobacterales bacterium HKCCSP123]|nr:DUF805 domain-containing protein [Rhodobacterales bacterium HKCCSP123]